MLKKGYSIPDPIEHSISSLSEYIDLIASGEYSDCIYRGEPEKYSHSNASAFRRNSQSSRKYPFFHMKNEFKRETYYKITADQRHDFLAFAQHHGIPTNLLDFTTSPLIALFFACKPYGPVEYCDDDSGYVYLIRNHLVNATKIISDNEDDNLFNLLLFGKKDIMANLYTAFSEYEYHYPLDFYIYTKRLYYDLYPEVIEYPEYEEGRYKMNLPKKFNSFIETKHKRSLQKIYKENEKVDPAIIAYLFSLQYYLSQIRKGKIKEEWIDSIPNFMYQPIFSFERGKNQLGLFLYQNYLNIDQEEGKEHLALQRIWPDIRIEVRNRREILKQLDLMGINEKFIYGDIDSIARYITNKYKDSLL